jgi:hypothetical protein
MNISDKLRRIWRPKTLAYFVVLVSHILLGVIWIMKYISELSVTRTKFHTVATGIQIIRIIIQSNRQVKINYYFKK